MDTILAKWNEILETVRVEYDIMDVSFRTWLLPLKVYRVEDDEITLLVNQEQALTIIQNKYMLPLRVTIAEITGTEYNIKFITPRDVREIEKSSSQSKPQMNETIERANLNPKYTFDTFVVGGNNNFAHAASLAVAESPGEMYNPLFLYGGVGLGKTHLMHSIAHFILDKDPNKKVLYVTSEYFTNELIEAIRNGNNTAMTKFREKYRNIDVLLIDDVQFIIGKESTQEEFFHTFNDLHGQKKQIIISSDKPPKDMETLEARLRSRFEWGLIADISSPDYETRMAILQKKEEMDGYNIDDEIIKYIATNIKSNIRELEGEKLVRGIDEYKKIRSFFTEDYYPVFGFDGSDSAWGGWQYHSPKKGAGILGAFRRPECPDDGMTVALEGLEKEAVYRFVSFDALPPVQYSGRMLTEKGFPVCIPEKKSSRLFLYKKISG